MILRLCRARPGGTRGRAAGRRWTRSSLRLITWARVYFCQRPADLLFSPKPCHDSTRNPRSARPSRPQPEASRSPQRSLLWYAHLLHHSTFSNSPKIYLDYMLFLERLLQQADIEASKMGDKKITRRHIDATFTVSTFLLHSCSTNPPQDVLKEFRG